MEHAHTANHDSILASFLEQGTLPEVAKRVNMSLASLATWASKHADLLASVHQLLTTRCKLIAAQLECAALSALAAVSSAAATQTDDTKLRERALERQRKAACAILRHRACLERPLRANGRSPSASSRSDSADVSPDALMPPASMPSSARSTSQPKPSLASRFAARRLAALASERA